MELVLDIVEKAPQLAGLGPIEKSKNKRSTTGGKRLPGARNLTARDKKVMEEVLVETGLTETEIQAIRDDLME